MALHKEWENAVLVVLTLLAIVANNVGGSMMAFVMPAFPAYLLYGTTLIYTIVFLPIAIIQDRHHGGPFGARAMSWQQQRQILLLAGCTSLNGLLFQFSDPWVSGPIAQVLSNLTIPTVWLCNFYILQDSTTRKENLGVSIVLGGIMVGIVPDFFTHQDAGGTQSNPWPALLAFALSAVVQGVEMTCQDRAMRKPYEVRAATALFWYNLYSLPAYLVTIPLESVPYLNGLTTGTSLTMAFENQVHAIWCAVGHPFEEDTISVGDTEAKCKPGALLWPQVFVLGYVGMFYLNALLIKRFNALWVGVINALGGPLAAVVFAFPAIVGPENYKQTNWPVVAASFATILVGVVVKGLPQEKQESSQEALRNDAEYASSAEGRG